MPSRVRIGNRSSKSVELRHHERVARTHRSQRLIEAGTFALCAADAMVDVDAIRRNAERVFVSVRKPPVISTDDRTLTCSRGTFDREQGGIDLAYAMTSYGVQGSTMDVSTSVVTASTGRSEIYVDMTRGRHQNQLFGTRPVVAASDDDRHLPTLDTELPEGARSEGTGRSAPARRSKRWPGGCDRPGLVCNSPRRRL